MRTLRLLGLLFLLSVWLAVPAHAQTTTTTPPPPTTTTATTVTTTTMVTTTTTIPTTVGVCASIEHIQPSAYWMAGTVGGTANYASGGMGFSTPNTMKAAAACLCHSRFRKVLGVLFGSVNGWTFSWDPTALKILAFTAPSTQLTDTSDIHAIDIPFVAVCQ